MPVIIRLRNLSSSLLSKNLKVRIYKTVILPVLLYGCETWTLTLREEYRLRVFENKVLRKIFGAKWDELTGEWRKLHNKELHALYSSPDIIRNIKSRRLRWAGHVARMGESRNAYRVLVGRLEGKRHLDRDRWRAYVRAAMILRVPEKPFEGNLSHMDMTGIKTECVDQSYDIKSEIKVEDIAPVPMSFIVVKSEVDEDLFDVGRVQQKQKVEVSSKEDEVLTESFGDNEKRVIRECTGIDREKDNLTECDSKRPDCSNLFDVSRNCIKCHMCNEVFVSEQRLKVHFDIHTEIKSLRCNVYEESFSSSPNLKTDACMERDERPFKCNICGKGLTRLSDLNRHHVRIHTGQKPLNASIVESVSQNRRV
ncbi:hypothetical protein ANN_27539 [Periplaneta americana]|uniref:C2H2-type domain-containing protein n=1 Tax=Periplaneta americana TaxID=6978 RepID=A0ABQ8RW77_PERAM|nr:hypothetical protein ANN_27539 [Periplaneta americana]